MPIADCSILPVSSSDLPILGNFVHSSKLPLTINRLLFIDWPNEVAQKTLYSQAVESAFKDPSVDCLKVVNDESRDIVGYVVLTRKRPANPERRADKENGDGKQNIPDGFNPDVYTAVSKAATEIAKEMEGIDHFGRAFSICELDVANQEIELTYICVKPLSRRHGIGSQLVQLCCERAKAEGVPLAVSSEPAAYDFFVKLGLRDTKHVDMNLSKWAPAYSGFGVFRLAGLIWSH